MATRMKFHMNLFSEPINKRRQFEKKFVSIVSNLARFACSYSVFFFILYHFYTHIYIYFFLIFHMLSLFRYSDVNLHSTSILQYTLQFFFSRKQTIRNSANTESCNPIEKKGRKFLFYKSIIKIK